jgi:hypothetical protein
VDYSTYTLADSLLPSIWPCVMVSFLFDSVLVLEVSGCLGTSGRLRLRTDRYTDRNFDKCWQWVKRRRRLIQPWQWQYSARTLTWTPDSQVPSCALFASVPLSQRMGKPASEEQHDLAFVTSNGRGPPETVNCARVDCGACAGCWPLFPQCPSLLDAGWGLWNGAVKCHTRGGAAGHRNSPQHNSGAGSRDAHRRGLSILQTGLTTPDATTHNSQLNEEK